eukprot:14577580-Alexandrium_andersonii.AAC.1
MSSLSPPRPTCVVGCPCAHMTKDSLQVVKGSRTCIHAQAGLNCRELDGFPNEHGQRRGTAALNPFRNVSPPSSKL